MNNLKVNIAEAAKDSEKAITDYGNKASEELTELKDKAIVTKYRLGEHISDNPWKSVYLSLFIGAVLGFLLRR